MIKKGNSSIISLIIHKIGNKHNDTKNAFSEEIVTFDEESYNLILPFLLKPFTSLTQSYRFTNADDKRLNCLNSYSSEVFESNTFVETSKNIVKHLFEQSNSAQIKTGDVLVVHFDGIEYENMVTDALGIFKIENKVDFLQTYLEEGNFDILTQKGISIKKLDKGCLILNQKDNEGPIILSVDNNSYDAQYWTDNFLEVQYAKNKGLYTQKYLEMCREFSEEVLKDKKEKASFLANTVDFFKENEDINYEYFKEEVLLDESLKSLFEDFKKEYEDLNDLVLKNNFEVSDAVVKKEKKKFKTDIKLDTHIQIKLDIDAPDAASEHLEKGYDEDKKMFYYKVFFNEEK